MRKMIICLSISLLLYLSVFSQSRNTNSSPEEILYTSAPNHIELIRLCLDLACQAGWIDTLSITYKEISDRLKAGAYSEDFDPVPGVIGDHFPEPWNSGPTFNFQGYFPLSRIPYGSYLDPLGGWNRGLHHGYDPVQNFNWPGADMSTIIWANSPLNNLSWNNAVSLYKSGEKAEAYQCLGHILHLLMDLSIPGHVKVINHGMSIGSVHTGTILDPDILVLIVDEYEIALSGGIHLPDIPDFIPDLFRDFMDTLDSLSIAQVPNLQSWSEYFNKLALYTYNDSLVNKYYSAPAASGAWGAIHRQNGDIAVPAQYFLTLPSKIDTRYAQVSLRSTAGINGTVIPPEHILQLCARLVPAALYYGTGLLKYFSNTVTAADEETISSSEFILYQNYPNPFNPETYIRYRVGRPELVTIKIYDNTGTEIAVVVQKDLMPGIYEFKWKAENLSSGIYFCRLSAGNFSDTKRMVLLK